jgi:hypothetical protein
MVQGLQSKTGDFGIHVPESPSLPFSGKELGKELRPPERPF